MKKQFVLSGLAVASIVVASEQVLADELDENLEEEITELPLLVEESSDLIESEIVENAPVESTYIPIDEEAYEELDIEPSEQMATEADDSVQPAVIVKAKVAKAVATVSVIDKTIVAADSPPTFLEQFPDKALRDAVLSNFYGMTEDSVITDSVIQSAYELNITGKDVKDLTGIGIFKEAISIMLTNTGIKKLSQDMMNYQNLVVLGLENNEEFEELDPGIWNLPIDAFHIISSPKLKSIPQVPEGAKVLSTMSYLAIEGTHITDASFVMHKRFNRLRMLILDFNHIVQLPDSDTYPILSNNSAMYVVMNGNQIVSVPEIYKSYKTLYPGGSFAIGMDLTDPSVHSFFDYSGTNPSQLVLKNTDQKIVVSNGTLDALHEFVDIKNEHPYKPIPLELSRAHNLQLVELIDDNGNPVELEAYYKDGVVIQDGIIRAKIRSMPGANPIGELSPYALTEYVEVQFQIAAQPVTVNYLNEDGETIAPTITLTGARGEQYTTEKLLIEGYEFLYVDGDTTGVFGLESIEVNYVYAEKTPETGVEGEGGNEDGDDDDGEGTGAGQDDGNHETGTLHSSGIGALPQTSGATATLWNVLGIALLSVVGVLLVRRRKNEQQL